MDIRLFNQDSILTEVEKLRREAFDIDFISDIYKNRFKEKQLLILGAFVNDELIGALYFSPYFSANGYIEQLFVRKDYQNCSLHVGSSLLNYLETHIEEIENYFDTYFNRFYIEYMSDLSERIYLKAGYKRTLLDGTLTKKVGIK